MILLFSLPTLGCFGGVAKVVGIGEGLPYTACSIQWLSVINLPHTYVL